MHTRSECKEEPIRKRNFQKRMRIKKVIAYERQPVPAGENPNPK
jgi:hypothetical protein